MITVTPNPDGYAIVRHGASEPMCMWACVEHLIRAADILLNQKNYDGNGHEILSEAKINAEKYLKELLVKQPQPQPLITDPDAREIIEAVAHIGVDFGYGAFVLSQEHIEKARAILDKLNNNCKAK